MKLVKRKAEDDLQFILKEDVEADFIHANWLNIKDAHNNIIGTVTGYRINIPLFVNDIFITEGRKSAFELDAISQLCSDLWCILYENIDRFKHKSGELLFLNRLELKKRDNQTEALILDMLKEQYEFIIYSLGKTDYLYDDFERTWEENEYEENKRHLSQTGWVNFSDNFFFFENDKLTRKKTYPSALLNQVDFNNSFEIWLKNKGVNWINSLWQGFIKQCSIAYSLERIAALQQNSTTGLDALKFLKNIKFMDFEQIDPRNEYFGNPPAYAKYLRVEALYATYKRKKYMIQFSQDICREDEELMEFISFGTYDNELESYCIGCEEVFDFSVESWVQEIFKEFFNRCYAQFMEEVKTAFISFPKDGEIVLFSDLVNRKK